MVSVVQQATHMDADESSTSVNHHEVLGKALLHSGSKKYIDS